MSAALQLPMMWSGSSAQRKPKQEAGSRERAASERAGAKAAAQGTAKGPTTSLAFYRRHTEKMLRRYLYASMQVGRSPAVLGDPVARGWASSRPIKTFEDAIIFVLDVESCLRQLGKLEQDILCRVVMQEYTQAEAAVLLGMSVRTMSYKFPQALDCLTELLLQAGILLLPS